MKLIHIFMSTTKKIQVNGNGCENILFRIDVQFSEYLLAVEIDDKVHTDRDLLFEEKIQEALEKKLGCTFITINTSKKGEEDYKIGRIQKSISKFKNRKLRKLKNRIKQKIKELEDEIKKLKI